MKSLKIMSVYCGQRRPRNNNPQTPSDALLFLKKQIENEKSLDPGADMDLLLVNNDANCLEANEYIASLEGVTIYSGVIKTITRPNKGGSFGAFSHGFDLQKEDYDYFLFNEDDIMIYEPGYLSHCITLIEGDPDIGFVALSPISFTYPIHCGGGFGLSSKPVLNTVCDNNGGKLPYHDGVDYNTLERSEVIFTSVIVNLGYKMINSPLYSTVALNYIKHTSQMNPHFLTQENLSKKHIYKVGF